jgi:hypothetical protein
VILSITLRVFVVFFILLCQPPSFRGSVPVIIDQSVDRCQPAILECRIRVANCDNLDNSKTSLLPAREESESLPRNCYQLPRRRTIHPHAPTGRSALNSQ